MTPKETAVEKELDEIKPTEVNVAKASVAELRKTPQTAGNNLTITRKILASEKKVSIKISSTETDKTAVFVQVNGVPFNIPRDKFVEVPMSVLKILEKAVLVEYRVEENKGGESAKIVIEERARFPFQSKEVSAE